MEIEELRVKIVAEMASLRSALEEIKSKLKGVDSNVKDSQQSFTNMGNAAAKSVNATKAAVSDTRKELNKVVQSVNEVINKYGDLKGAMVGFSSGKVFKLDMEQAKKELADTEAQIKNLYEELDARQAEMLHITDPTELAKALQDLTEINADLNQAEENAAELRAQLSLGGDGVQNTTKELENLKLKLQEVKEARDRAMNDLKAMSGNWNSDETQAQILKVAQLTQEYQKLYGAALQAQKAANPPAQEEWVSFRDRVRGVGRNIGYVVEEAANAGKFIATGFAKAATAAGKLTMALGKVLNKLNPIPKLANKLGNAFKTLMSKVRTAFIYSAINQWFREIREQIRKYLSANSELQSALSISRGAWLTAFQPIWEAIIPAIIQLIGWLTKLAYAIASITARINGKSVAANQANAKALNAEANAIDAVGGSAKEASKYLASFDELNVMPDNSGGGGGGSDEESGVSFGDIEEAEGWATWGEWFSDFLDKIIAKLPRFNELLEKAAEKINKFSENLLEMFTYDGIQEKISTIGQGLADAFNNFLDKVDWNQLGEALGAGINSILNLAVNFIETFDWKKLGSSIAELLNGVFEQVDFDYIGRLLVSGWNIVWESIDGFVSNLDWALLGEKISTGFTSIVENIDLASFAHALSTGLEGIMTTLIKFFKETDWGKIGNTIYDKLIEMLENIDWDEIVGKAYELAGAATGASVKLAVTLAERFIKTIIEGFHQAKGYFAKEIEAAGGNVIEGIFTGIDKAILAVKARVLYWKLRFVQAFLEAFGISSEAGGEEAPAEEMVPIGESVMSGVLVGIVNVWGSITNWFSTTFQSIKTLISNTWEAIKKNTVDKWIEIKNAVVYKIEEIRNKVVNKFNEIRQRILNVNEEIKQNISRKWEELKSNVVNTVETLKTNVTTKWETLKTNVVSKAENLKEEVKRKYEALKSHLSTLTDGIGLDIFPKWEEIKNTIVTVAETISTKVGEAFEMVKDGIVGAFTAAKGLIKQPINDIIGFINQMISGIVSGINNMIYALNQLSFTLPDWVPVYGNRTFGLNIQYVGAPQIPLLAKGGVITDPTLAMLGEYKGANNNPEIVAPQSLLHDTIINANGEMVSALYQMATQIINAIEDVDMEVVIGDDVIAQSAKRGSDSYKRRTGRTMFA